MSRGADAPMAPSPGAEVASTLSEGSSAEKADLQQLETYLPVRTMARLSNEQESLEGSELKAYKLGKKRWLYNECRLILRSPCNSLRVMHIREATRMPDDSIGAELQDCGLAYQVHLRSGQRLELEVYLAFDEPEVISGAYEQQNLDHHPNFLGMDGGLEVSSLPGYRWPAVRRSKCCKNCSGPILRSIQRYGRISRRSSKKPASSDTQVTEDRPKDPSCLYLSIDEATTHVGSRRFRLIAALFDHERVCLSTCCSAPINVLANNDAPNGPAFIDLDLPIADSWEGWCQADMDMDLEYEVHPRNDSVNSVPVAGGPYRMDSVDPSGSTRYSGMLTPQQSMRAQIDLAYIRERAMKQRAEDEDDISYDDENPCKRQCSSYLRNAELPREYFQPSPQVSGLKTAGGFMDHPFLTEERIRLHEPVMRMQGGLQQEPDGASMRHSSMSDSTMHFSPLTSQPHPGRPPTGNGILRAHSMAVNGDPGMLRGGNGGGGMHFGGQGSLLSELHAQRAEHGSMDSAHPFWQQQMRMMPTQGISLRQESSPADFMGMRGQDAWEPSWVPTHLDSRTQAAPPIPPDLSVLSNPFAVQGASDELLWTKNMRAHTPTPAAKSGA